MEKPHYLSTRPNWQLQANKGGAKSESRVFRGIKGNLNPKEFEVVNKPNWFNTPFLELRHSLEPMIKPENPKIGDEWCENGVFYRLTAKGKRRIGETFVADVGIIHLASNRRFIIEVKKQGNKGNAHERACKYMTPGMIEYLKTKMNIEYYPVGFVFTGLIAETEKYRREITFLLGRQLKSHVLFWKKDMELDDLAEWFESTVRPLLCQ